MKNIVLLIISTLFFNVLIAQNQAIKMTNTTTNKEKIIKDNRRIKLQTTDGQKFKGRFKIEDTNQIVIDGVRIHIADINELKRHPLLTSILSSGFLIYGGAVTAGMGAIIGVFANPAGFWLTIPGAAMIYAGIKSPNINKNHKVDKGWEFEIISIPD